MPTVGHYYQAADTHRIMSIWAAGRLLVFYKYLDGDGRIVSCTVENFNQRFYSVDPIVRPAVRRRIGTRFHEQAPQRGREARHAIHT